MTIDVEKLKALAEAATPGPWGHCPSGDCRIWVGPVDRATKPGILATTCGGNDEANGAFIAAASPDVVLALVNEVATLRAEMELRDAALALRPLDEWHEDYGEVLWYRVPIQEPPFVSSPNSSDWLLSAKGGRACMTREQAEDEDRLDQLDDGGEVPWATHWCPLPKVTP